MIESEEKRNRLTDIITRWCEFTKHTNLRDGDISGLVGSILGEFYHIYLSCGHMVRESKDGVTLTFKDNCDGKICDIIGDYCKDCAELYKKNLNAKEINKVNSKYNNN
jgi:hypothetical protein